MPTYSQSVKSYLIGLLFVVLMAGGLECLLNLSAIDNEIDSELAVWNLPSEQHKEASIAETIKRLRANGRWAGIDELLEYADGQSSIGNIDESVSPERKLYTLVAIVQPESRGQLAAIVVGEHGEVVRIHEGDEFGGSYRLEEILNEQVKLQYVEPAATNNVPLSVTLRLYPDAKRLIE